MADLSAVASKLGRFIRLLSSDQDGEVIAAARAVVRTLKGAGQDIHALAAVIEKPNGRLSEHDMKIIYNAGYEDGVRSVEAQQCGTDGFRNTDGSPSWYQIASWCQRRSDQLGDRERKFIDSVTSQTVWREPSAKQEKWLRSIYHKLGGTLV